MAKRKDSRAARETLEEIDSVLDHIEAWVSDHPPLVIAIIAGILAVAGSFGGYQAYSHHHAAQAATAVSSVEQAYLKAMGAPPGSYQVVEPANPATGRKVRKEYAQRFLDTAKTWSGTTAAVRAYMEAGQLLEEAGEGDAAVKAWQGAVDAASRDSLLKALALVRFAQGLDQQGQPARAASAWQKAGEVKDYPGAALAMAQAARAFADAGDAAKAIQAFKRAQQLAGSNVPLPPYLVARLRHLETSQGASDQGGTAGS